MTPTKLEVSNCYSATVLCQSSGSVCAAPKMNRDFSVFKKMGEQFDVQAETPPLILVKKQLSQLRDQWAHPETDGCKSDEGPGWSQEPAGVQQKSGQAGGMD